MANRHVMIYLSLLIVIVYCCAQLTSTTDRLKIYDGKNQLPNFKHASYFISYLCQQQKQYSLYMRKKYCSSQFPSSKSQEEQRGKRVGWTISV
ncbi:hypothetical protein I4U23_008396 [Adineta vaga]|nr:hypothetical protein I4U23_008396 [Adineta vaga]